VTRHFRYAAQEEEVVAELSVARGAEGNDGDIDPACARPVRLRLAVRVPQVTALKMELSRVTGSAGSALVRSPAARPHALRRS
jgi:hypothetical protein